MNLLSLGYGLSSRPSIASVGLTVSGHTGGVANIGDTLTPSVDGATLYRDFVATATTGAYTVQASDAGKILHYQSGGQSSTFIFTEVNAALVYDSDFDEGALDETSEDGTDIFDLAGITHTFQPTNTPNATLLAVCPDATTGRLLMNDAANFTRATIDVPVAEIDQGATISISAASFSSTDDARNIRVGWSDGSGSLVGDTIAFVSDGVNTVGINLVDEILDPPDGAVNLTIRFYAENWSNVNFTLWRLRIGAPLGALGATPPRTTDTVVANGVTFTLAAPASVAYDRFGNPIVYSSTAVTVTNISPAGANDGTYDYNGAMLNPPVFDATGNGQGYDGSLVAGSPTAKPSYSSAANVDPAHTGQNVSISPGGVLNKSVRDPSYAGPGWQTFEKFVSLHVVDATWTSDDILRPAIIGGNSDLRGAIDLSNVGSVAASTGMSSAADILAASPVNMCIFGAIGEGMGRYYPVMLGVATGYSVDLFRAVGVSELLLGVHVDDPQQGEIALRVALWAKDYYGLWGSGWRPSRGAGQNSDPRAECLLIGSALLGDTDMLAAGQAIDGHLNQPYWIEEQHVASIEPSWPSNSGGEYQHSHLTDEVGTIWWARNFPFTNDQIDASQHERYLTRVAEVYAAAVMCIGMCQSPNGGTMESEITGGVAIGPDNDTVFSRALAWADFVRCFRQPQRSGNVPVELASVSAFYNTYRDDLENPRWTQRPARPSASNTSTPTDNQADSASTWGDGQISADYSPVNNVTETFTGMELQYSLDGVQWATQSIASRVGAATGLLKSTTHWHRSAFVSTPSGRGPWSVTSPIKSPAYTNNANVFDTTGTASNSALVNTEAPAIHIEPYPLIGQSHYEQIGATPSWDDITNLELTAGFGYWSGHPAPTIGSEVYDWFVGGASEGVDSKTYTLTAANAGETLQFSIVPTNGVTADPAAVLSNTITIPALPSIPSGFVVDMRGAAVDELVYGDVLATANTSNAFFGVFGGLNARPCGIEQYGLMRLAKNGQGQSVDLNLNANGRLLTHTTYRLTIVFAKNFANGNNPNGIRVKLGRSQNGTQYVTAQTIAATTGKSAETFTAEFTTSGSVGACWLEVAQPDDLTSPASASQFTTRAVFMARIALEEV